MKKGYLVLEVGYEHNDEYYSTGNHGTSYEKPTKIYLDRDVALAEVDKRNVKAYRESTLGMYMQDGDLKSILKKEVKDHTFMSKWDEMFPESPWDEDDSYEFSIPKKATDEQVKIIMDMMKLVFFELVEVPVEE